MLVGLVAVAGCDLDDLDPTSESAPGSGGSAPPQDADSDLLEDVTTTTDAVLMLVAALRRRHPALAGTLRPLGEMHVAHRTALGGPERSASHPPMTTRGPAAALALVRDRELRFQRQLADWSVAARSGPLARLLAAMSAAVAQQLAVLPRTPGGAA